MKSEKKPLAETIKFLTDEEILKFFVAIRRARENDAILLRRDLALFHSMLLFGLRVSEISRIKVENLNLSSKRIFIRGDFHPLSDYGTSLLTEWIEVRSRIPGARKNPYLFISTQSSKRGLSGVEIWHLFRKYAKAAGIDSEKRHPSTLRHSCAMRLVKAGYSGSAIQERLGHKSLLSAEVYLSLSGLPGWSQAAEAVLDIFEKLTGERHPRPALVDESGIVQYSKHKEI